MKKEIYTVSNEQLAVSSESQCLKAQHDSNKQRSRTKTLLSFLCSLFSFLCSLSCENPMIADVLSDYYGTISSPNEVKDYLLRRHGGWTENDPITLRMDMNLSGANWEEMFRGIGVSGKYIDLDLSKCTPGSGYLILYSEIDTGHIVFDPKVSFTTVGSCYSSIVSITLPDTATKIKDYYVVDTPNYGAFKDFHNLRHVTGNNIIEIGDYAFQDRYELRSINFPKVINIGNGAFIENHKLESVNIPNVMRINYLAFYRNYSLRSISLPNVTEINYKGVFAECTNLENVSIPKVRVIGEEAFKENLSLKNITIPVSCNTIEANAFANCSNLTTVTFLGSDCIIEEHNAFPQGSAPGAKSLKTAYEVENDRSPGTYRFDGTNWYK